MKLPIDFEKTPLVPVVIQDDESRDVLMMAFMNQEAFERTLSSGLVHFWSRSRNKLWMKGETSGNVQRVVEMRTDCDQDALWLRVEVGGDNATCHTGRRSCFYRVVEFADGRAGLRDDAQTY